MSFLPKLPVIDGSFDPCQPMSLPIYNRDLGQLYLAITSSGIFWVLFIGISLLIVGLLINFYFDNKDDPGVLGKGKCALMSVGTVVIMYVAVGLVLMVNTMIMASFFSVSDKTSDGSLTSVSANRWIEERYGIQLRSDYEESLFSNGVMPDGDEVRTTNNQLVVIDEHDNKIIVTDVDGNELPVKAAKCSDASSR